MKVIRRLLTALFVILATCSVLNIYNVTNETSVTYGNFEHYDLYENFDIYTMEENPVFYLNNGVYEYTHEYPISVNFNGTNNDYNLLFNDKPCSVVNTTAGKLDADYILSFHDLDNVEISTTTLNIHYDFYVSNFVLTMSATMTEDQLKLLNEYFAVNGCELRIIDNVYYGGNEEELSKVYVNFYDSEDNLITTYSTGYNSVIINDYISIAPIYEDKTFIGWAVKGSTELVDLSTYKFTANTDLVPIYENKKVVNYLVDNTIIDTEYYAVGDIVYFNEGLTPTKDDYTFFYWGGSATNGSVVNFLYLDSTRYLSFEMQNFEESSIDMEAVFYYNGYVAKFTYTEGNEEITQEIYALTREELISNIPIITAPTGYNFAGWAISGTSEIVDFNTYDFKTQVESLSPNKYYFIPIYELAFQSYELLINDDTCSSYGSTENTYRLTLEEDYISTAPNSVIWTISIYENDTYSRDLDITFTQYNGMTNFYESIFTYTYNGEDYSISSYLGYFSGTTTPYIKFTISTAIPITKIIVTNAVVN